MTATVVTTIESNECIVTIAKVLDNILTEKEYNKKTRKLKLSNPTFEKRVVRHVGGVDFLKACGFTQRKDILELKQQAEQDKGLLWLARIALQDHAATKNLTLPAIPNHPNAMTINAPPALTTVVLSPTMILQQSLDITLMKGTAAVPSISIPPPQLTHSTPPSPLSPNGIHTTTTRERERSFSNASSLVLSTGMTMCTDDTDNNTDNDDDTDLQSEIMQALMDNDEHSMRSTPASTVTLPPMEIVTNALLPHVTVSDDDSSILSKESSVFTSVSTQPHRRDHCDSMKQDPNETCVIVDPSDPWSPMLKPPLIRKESDPWGDALEPPSRSIDPLVLNALQPITKLKNDTLIETNNSTLLGDMDRLQRERKLEQDMAEALNDFNTSMSSITHLPQPFLSDTESTPISSNATTVTDTSARQRIPMPPMHNIDDLNNYFDEQSSQAPQRKLRDEETPNSSSSDLESEMSRLLAEASEIRGRTLVRSSSWTPVDLRSDDRARSPSLRKPRTDISLPDEYHYSSFHAHKDWNTLDKVMCQASLQKEYEPSWGSLCTLSVVCADLPTIELALPASSSNKKKSRKTWLPLELVQGLWKLVLVSEGKLNPLRIDDVCQKLHDVLVKSEFLEVYERGVEDQDLPHSTWVRIRKEKMVLLGFALPISIEKQNVWMKNLANAIVEDVQFWYGRYALPAIALAGGDDQTLAMTLLRDLEFVQTRLDVLGMLTGTCRHMQDCRAYIKAQRDAFRDRKFIPEEQEPGRVTEIGYDVALDACQRVATCLYRTGQLLGKMRGTAAKKQELCSALHIVGMSAGEWGDYEFEIQIYHKAMKVQIDIDGTASVASADLLLSMGACNLGLGDFNSAMGCYEEARLIFEGRLGKTHDKIAKVLHLKGVVHCERSEHGVAMECFKMSLTIRQDNGMANDYDAAMADTLCWIGRVYREEDLPLKAKKYFEAARDAKEEIFGADSLEVAEIVHNIAVIYDDEEQFDQSLSYYRKSLKIRRAVLGEEHEDVCELITCIGNVYRSMGDNSTALKAFRRALDLRSLVAKSIKLNRNQTEALICSHEDVLELLSQEIGSSLDPDATRDDIASVLLKMGHLYDTISNFDKSLKCFERALKMRQNTGDGAKAAQVYNVLGISFAKRRKFADAMDSFEQSLSLRKAALGEWNTDVAETLHNMGNCAAKKGDLDDAKSYYDESLRIKRKNLGNGHASVAQTLHNLGNIMSQKGSTEAAMQNYQDALSIRVNTLGTDHLDVAYSLHCIAKIHKKKHNIKAAQEYFNNALRIKHLHLRKNHTSIAESLEQLGLLYAEIGSQEEASTCLMGALNIFKSKNRDSSKVTEIYEALGDMFERNGDECNALNNFSKALRIQTKVFGEDNIKVADMYYKVGLLQKARKSTREALLSFQAATRARKKASGRNDIMIADILCEAGQLQIQLNQVDVADKCFIEALRIRRQLLESGHEKIGESLLFVGDVYYAKGLYENAIEAVIEALDIFKLIGSSQGVLAAGACRRLGATYKACNDCDKALKFYNHCLDINLVSAGNHSLVVAEINHELGAVHFARGDFSRAEELFRESVEVKVKALGEDSLEVASTVHFLGRVCLKMNSPDEANMYFEQARLTKQLRLGETHLECFEITYDIGQAHEAKGELEESLTCYNSYLRARRSSAGDDEVVSDILYCIGHVEYLLKRSDDSLKSFASALALYRVLLGDDHANVAKTLFSLGLVYETKWEYKESMKYHKEAFRLRRRLWGNDDISVAESLDKISSLYMKQPNLGKALQSTKEALRIRTFVHGKGNLDVATSLFAMGVIFNDIGDTEKAMECYVVSLDIRKEKLGEASVEVAQTLHNLGTTYAKVCDYSNALSHWRQALGAYRDAGYSDENHLVSIAIGNIKMAENYQEEQAKLQATWR